MPRNFTLAWLGKLLSPTIVFVLLPFRESVRSQIVPDSSLGAESSIVSSSMTGTTQIDGGARRGSNLFHSFRELSVPMGREAFFNNDLSVENIINRVTGNSISNIDGTLRSNGTANLFLLNPNGIVFGPEARLSLGGSFFATTAESLNFADGRTFGAIAPSHPLLTVNAPIGLQFGENPGSIVNRSQALRPVPLPLELPIPSNAGLEVLPGRTLASIGGDIFLENGNLTAVQGEVRLGSVAGPGVVTFVPTPTGIELDYEGIADFGTIELSGMATIDVSGAGGGTISLRGSDIVVREDANLLAVTFGDSNGRGIEVTGDRFLSQENALISTTTLGAGSGGDLTIRTAESVELSGPTSSALQELQTTVLIGAIDMTNAEFGSLTATTGEGRAGTATIETRNFTIKEGALLGTSTAGGGAGGSAIVRAEAIEIDAASLFSSTGPAATGNSGDIVLETQTLRLANGGAIFAITLGAGSGGNIIVRATDLVEIVGSPEETLFPSGLGASSLIGNGLAGRVEIDARRIVIAESGFVSSQSGLAFATFAIPQGGPGNNVVLRASESIELRGPSVFVTATSFSNAPAGDVNIQTREFVVDGASVDVAGDVAEIAGSASSIGNSNMADAGTLTISADSVRLENGGALSASTVSGLGGNISIQTRNLRLEGQSTISTDAGSSDGGNIAIATDNLVAFGNSDITANAQTGSGGQITIEAAGVFGTQFRNFSTPDSDITATSSLGAEFSGTVQINEPEVDPSSTFISLPENPLDVAVLFDRNPCHNFFHNGEFYAIGRGGIAPHPFGEAIPHALLGDRLWIAANRTTSDARSHSELSEAIGWERDENGNVVALLGETVPYGNRCNEP